MAARNWDSPNDAAAAFRALGVPLTSMADEVLARVGEPLADLFRWYPDESGEPSA